jgi:L-alanine-DL-glutamate epimerase-like enolase superfamily enzyme
MGNGSKRHSRRRFLRASAAAPLAWAATAGMAAESPTKLDQPESRTKSDRAESHVKIDRGHPQVKIGSIDVFLVYYPWTGYWKFLEGSPGHGVVFVKITADDGTVGWGQSLPVPTWSYETPETALIVLRRYFAPALIGRDPLDLEACQHALDHALAPSFTTAMPISRAGLDIALHDLAGRLTGRSLAEMWGRPPGGPVRLNWTINARSLDELESQVATARERGYGHFNVKIGDDPRFDVAVARRIRRLAPDGHLWLDANGKYDLATAREVAPKLADAGVDVLEAPLRPNRISAYQALKKQAALPITMDEGVISPVEAEAFIRLGMVDGLTVKVSRCGGFPSARRQIELVRDAGLFWLCSGLTDPDVSLAASLALCGAYDLDKPAALNGPQFLTADVLAKPLAITGDVARVPIGPGLGVDVDESKIRELRERTKKIKQAES